MSLWHLAVLEDEAGFAYLLRSSDPWGRAEALGKMSAGGTSFSVERAFVGAGNYEGLLRRQLRDFRDDSAHEFHGQCVSRYLCTAQHLLRVAMELLPAAAQGEPSGRGVAFQPGGAADLRVTSLRQRARLLLEQAEELEQRASALLQGSTGESMSAPEAPPALAPKVRLIACAQASRSEAADDQAWMQHINWRAW